MSEPTSSILIVDDEREIREVIANVARRTLPMVRAIVAADAFEAEKVVLSENVTAILTDLRMPGRSGIELLQWAAEHAPHTKRALMTGFHEDVIDGVDLHSLGLAAVLRKPFSARDLRELLGTLAK